MDPYHNIFVGAETGLLKGINVEKRNWTNINSIQNADREKEITAMCWGNSEETQVCFGLRDRTVLTYDRSSNDFEDPVTFTGGEGTLKGLAKYEEGFITCVESGELKVWRDGKDDIIGDAGRDVYRMRQNNVTPHIVATGGKENDLKIWDLKNPTEPIFQAKNVRHDWLNLRVPVWITDMAFLPESEKVVTCTGHHQVRVYDPTTSQRRPVIDIEFEEYPITSLGLRPCGNQVIVGNSQGNMALIDLRKKRMVQIYKGFAGGIKSIQCHPTLPIVASCGLDRFLRIHDIESKELLHKFYLKSRLNCLLFSTKWTEDKPSAKKNKTVSSDIDEGVHSEDEENSDVNEDTLWENMDTVKPQKRKQSMDTVKPQKRKQSKVKLHTKGKKMKVTEDSTAEKDISKSQKKNHKKHKNSKKSKVKQT